MPRASRAVLGALLLASIASGNPVATASADPVVGGPIPAAPTEDGRFVVIDDPSIGPGHPLRADSWSTAPANDSVLSLHFMLPSPDCTGVHAEVAESADSVAVTLRSGTQPRAVGRMCTMIVVPAELTLTLQAPLGDRKVLIIN